MTTVGRHVRTSGRSPAAAPSTSDNPWRGTISCEPAALVQTGQVTDPTCPEGEEPTADRPTVSTITLAHRANGRLPIPVPAVKTAPPRGKKILVQMPTWFWLDKSQWGSRSKTAQAPGVWAKVTAEAYQLSIEPGDGSEPVECTAPGTPYSAEADEDDACTHTSRHSGRYTVTVTASWAANWHGSDGNGGILPTLQRSASSRSRSSKPEASSSTTRNGAHLHWLVQWLATAGRLAMTRIPMLAHASYPWVTA